MRVVETDTEEQQESGEGIRCHAFGERRRHTEKVRDEVRKTRIRRRRGRRGMQPQQQVVLVILQ